MSNRYMGGLTRKLLLFLAETLIAGLVMPAFSSGMDTVHHDIRVRIDPASSWLSAEDQIALPSDWKGTVLFSLDTSLSLEKPAEGTEVQFHQRSETDHLRTYEVVSSPDKRQFLVRYAGRLNYPFVQFGEEQARGFQVTRGIIGNEGVYLAGETAWYPVFRDRMMTFSLEVLTPEGWESVSQGSRTPLDPRNGREAVRWDVTVPQDEIYLVAAPFTLYTKPAGRIEAMAYLRTPDEKLAGKYLDATARYIAMYEDLIGPYPYGKFALVENFWETGWGMPSFTLLGSKVIRFPFILHSSYPHEILHNWWGNSVYPDYGAGNWSEGLTAYLADHLIKEQRGQGAEHRLATLQKYADYVSEGKDFPLTDFTSRHSSSSEAVGYGKALMFFHMLRRNLGDEVFRKGLQSFYRDNRFRTAGFKDLGKSFEAVAGERLDREFQQWVKRSGAPELRPGPVAVRPQGDSFLASVSMEQVQAGPPFGLSVPLVFTLNGRPEAFETFFELSTSRATAEFELPARPVRLDVDPAFDLFRRVSPGEVPPAITEVLGSEKVLFLLPAKGDEKTKRAYRDLATALAGAGPESVEVRDDDELDVLPDAGAVCLLGAENRFRDVVTSALAHYSADRTQKEFRFEGSAIPLDEAHSLVLVVRKPGNPTVPLMWIAAEPLEALAGLGRKLPHYHKYSYLAFEGPEPENVLKGRWPVSDSPMTVFLQHDGGGQRPAMGILPPRPPLAELPVLFSRERMLGTVNVLADAALEGRGLGSTGLENAAEFIADAFRRANLTPAGDVPDSYFQSWSIEDAELPGAGTVVRNVVGMIPGTNPDFAGQAVVVGAHYDHLGTGWPEPREEQYRGRIHPGADDNASGVAVLLELAGVLQGTLKPERPVIFVAFTGEEASRLGSRHFVETLTSSVGDNHVFAMLNLDTVGRLGDGKLLVLGGDSAREWVHIFRGVGYVTGVDIQLVSDPLDSSDQQSFIDAGIPAVQLFTGPHADYHRPSDTADHVDGEGLVKVASVAKETVEYLAGRQEPLSPGGVVTSSAVRPDRAVRSVRFGIIPDFTFPGPGCRLSGVMEGSPAERGGLRAGDVLIGIDERSVQNLRDLSDILKRLAPGEEITVRYIRQGSEFVVRTVLSAR